MPKYPESVLESIKSRLTVSEVISDYIRLERKGDRHWGLCPFHNEKTPSFTVLDSGGFYKCFGCGKGGSMFNFVMEMEHVSFSDAVEILAKKAGVELRPETDKEKQERTLKETLEDVYSRICISFRKILETRPEAEEARAYLAKRHVSPEIQEQFLLGFAPKDPRWLYAFLRKNNYSDEFLKTTGLFSKNYPEISLFNNRIMFPIRTWQGKCVAFGGRDLSGESKAKYINTPETQLYSKRHMLFGFYESIPTFKTKQEIILCEGNFDVIALHQAGLTYAAAPLGTAFTDEQAKLILRYCKKVSLLFDSDSAGQNATKKALLICQQHGLENFVIKLEGAKDASQLVEEQGEKALQDNCLKSVTGFSYLVSSAIKEYDIRQPRGKSSVFKEVRPYLDATEDGIERQGYIKYLSDILRISESQILGEYQKEKKEAPVEEKKPVTNTNPLRLSVDLTAMLSLINNRDLFPEFRKEVRIDMLQDIAAQELYTILEDASRSEVKTPDMLLQLINEEELRQLVVTSFSTPMYKREYALKNLSDAKYFIKMRGFVEQRNNIQGLINNLGMDRETDNSSILENLLIKKSEIDNSIEELKKQR